MFAGLRKLWNNGAIRIIVCNSARRNIMIQIFKRNKKNHKTIFVTVFFMLHCFSSYFLHRIGQAHNKEKANGIKNNCGQTNIHFLLCDFSSWWRRIDIDLSSDGTCFVSVYSQKNQYIRNIWDEKSGWTTNVESWKIKKSETLEHFSYNTNGALYACKKKWSKVN